MFIVKHKTSDKMCYTYGMNDFLLQLSSLGLNGEVQALGQLVLATLLGGILGLQRERRGKAAGPRTYALVTAGATLFTVAAVLAFHAPTEVGRMASQILIGIGFIGAGTIIRREDHVEGITTAAGLWFSAAIGLAIGLNLILLAVGATLLILLVLSIPDKNIPFSQTESSPLKTKKKS